MDLEAIRVQNAQIDRLTRLSMAACFFVTGGILLGALALATPDQAPASFETSTFR